MAAASGEPSPSPAGYQMPLKYWSSAKLDLDVVLCGYGYIHEADIADSKHFVDSLVEAGYLPHQRRYALDCGCGLGRISKDLLLPSFAHVDMVDFSPTYVQQARKHIGEEAFVEGRVANCFVESLHTFVPPARRYDLVWVQYVTGYLTDADLVAFLRRAADALVKPQEGSGGGGCIVVKEDVKEPETLILKTSEGAEMRQEANGTMWEAYGEDAWRVRPKRLLHELFDKAGLRVVAEGKQMDYPQDLYPILSFALKRKEEEEVAV